MHGGAKARGRKRGEHLVHVHVRRGARSGLVGVDRKLVVVVAADEFVGRVGDGRCDASVQNPQRTVDDGRGLLDAREGDDLGRL